MNKDRVVLAYSGGLDTSVCIKWLMENYNLDVIAMTGDVGQEHESLEAICDKAKKMGAIEAFAVDLRSEYVEDYIARALAANCSYEGVYPMVSCLSRPLIAKHLVSLAHQFGAKYVAHGCTGKGNDQVRFEVAVRALDPELKIIAPVREWNLHTRADEMAWAREHDISVPTTVDSPYSIDDNLWGRAIECGVLEDPWSCPPEEIYTMTVAPGDAPDKAQDVVLGFEGGLPSALDGQKMSFYDIILKMNEIAGAHGFGRVDMIENRLVGLKSRECYEVPGALTIIKAHRELENLCLERDTVHFKALIDKKWAELVYNGLWFSPLKEALDAFCASADAGLCGQVRLRFYKGSCTVTGRQSQNSLYDVSLATYDEGDSFNRDSAAGFIDLFGLPCRVWAAKKRAAKKTKESS